MSQATSWQQIRASCSCRPPTRGPATPCPGHHAPYSHCPKAAPGVRVWPGGPSSQPSQVYGWKQTHTLWWTNIAMENHHAIHGKIHYKWPFSIAMSVHQRVIETPKPESSIFQDLNSACVSSRLISGWNLERYGSRTCCPSTDPKHAARTHMYGIRSYLYNIPMNHDLALWSSSFSEWIE